MGSNPSTESNNTTEITARNKMQVLCMRRQGTMESSTHKGAKELKHSSKNHRGHTLATANNSLYKRYRVKELFERSPTLPQLSKTTAGIDGNLPEKLTVNSNQGLRNRERKLGNISLIAKKKTVKEKVVEKKQEAMVVVKKPVVAGSQAAPDKSKFGTNSDEDSRPLSKIGAAKKGGAAPKGKLVLASSDSESTESLPLGAFTKKQRTRRTKPVKETTADQAESNPSPIREIPTGAEDASTAAAPEENVESTEAIDTAVKGKGTLEAFARPNPVEEHCMLVLNSAWEEVSSKMTEYDEWALFRTEVRLNTIKSMTPIASMAKIEDEFMPYDETELGCIVSNKGTTTPDQDAMKQSTKAAKQRIITIEHRAHEEKQPATEDEETARIEQQAQDQIEEISRVVQNVEETEAEVEAVNSQEHQAQEHRAQEEERPAQRDKQQAQDEPAPQDQMSIRLKKNQLIKKSNQMSTRLKLVLPRQVQVIPVPLYIFLVQMQIIRQGHNPSGLQMVRYTADRDNNSKEDEEDFAQAGPQPINFSRPKLILMLLQSSKR
ncbi:pentatricopeptide repeat 5 [Dorcoceras hygrometricum]|uniref:Pentatricopeptide repeat 5 n=1 Tax=Dorcoceras hygrometricum TaxID=472368 RepID=A0A2Z7ASG3_9LAMI|nr:pentatricopeptide repeat 5 [Dorcoceras hygrometricum]